MDEILLTEPCEQGEKMTEPSPTKQPDAKGAFTDFSKEMNYGNYLQIGNLAQPTKTKK